MSPSTQVHSTPIGLKWRSSTLFIISTFALGVFIDTFLYGLLVPVLPFMLQDRVHVPKSEIQNTISNLLAIYAAAACLASPVVGVLADKSSSSRKVPFVLGLALLLLSTILLAVGRTVPVLAIARLLQGGAVGTVWTIGLALMIETVGQKNMGKTMGTIFSFVAVSGFFSPVLGGLLYAKTGYQGVFGVGIAFIAVDFIMRLLMIEKNVAARYSATRSPSPEPQTENDYDANESRPLLSENDDDRSAYFLPEPKSRITRAFPVLLMFRNPALLTATWICLVQAALIGAFDATVPLIVAELYSFDSFQAGLLFIPLGGMEFIFGPLFGWCVDRWGTRVITIIGFAWMFPALVLLRLPFEDSILSHLNLGHQIALFSCLLALNGFGMAIPSSVSTVESGAIVERYWKANKELFPQAPYAQLYGINSMVFNAGLSVGPLISGRLKESIGYGDMNAILAGIYGFTALLSTIFIGRNCEDD